jgi:SAM-dependent methyltransferase
MPDYQAIYDDIISRQENYNRAEHSPGYRACVQATPQLSVLGGRALDVGCGVGFALEYLAGQPLWFDVWGVDASAVAVERAQERLEQSHGLPADRVQRIEHQSLPFAANAFDLVTCFDMLEHLDEPDIDAALSEMFRVLVPGGTFLSSVSCRPAGSRDIHGDNLHRTIRGVDWWLARAQPDRAVYDTAQSQLTLWKRLGTRG